MKTIGESRSEYSAVQKRRCRRAEKAHKTRRIDKVCEACGYERKYAIKLLKICPVRIDRLLKPCKAQLQRRRNAGTKPEPCSRTRIERLKVSGVFSRERKPRLRRNTNHSTHSSSSGVFSRDSGESRK
jgi:hypothetical protein